MFLRATEMNSADMNLGGFFDVNRNLFKSVRLPKHTRQNFSVLVFFLQLLATMVTYLVVLLQFQISIPQDTSAPSNVTTTTVMPTTAQQ